MPLSAPLHGAGNAPRIPLLKRAGVRSKSLLDHNEGRRGGIGRTPAEIAEAYGREECRYVGAVFCNCLGLRKTVSFKISPKR